MAADTIDRLRLWVAEASGDDFKRRAAHYQASTRSGRIDGLLSVAGTDPDVAVLVEQLDTHHHLLACHNGTVDLRTGQLTAADPSLLITRGIEVDYDPEAQSDLWDGFIATAFSDDKDLIGYVQRLLGYCLTGWVEDHVVPVLTGVGANGKSTLIGVVQDLLGEHAITAPEGLVILRRQTAHPEQLAVLRGRRLVISAELEQQATLAEATVKTLSGGDTISARELYGRRFNFRPTHKIVLVTNHRPKVRGTDHAIWRRLRVVPFERVIEPEEQDPALRRRLVEEHAPAVLAWLVRGAVEWSETGLGEADAVKLATEDYRTAEDTIATWLAERTVDVQRARTKVGELYDDWRQWCAEFGEAPGRRQDFQPALAAHGIALESGRNAVARGIGLAAALDSTPPETFL